MLWGLESVSADYVPFSLADYFWFILFQPTCLQFHFQSDMICVGCLNGGGFGETVATVGVDLGIVFIRVWGDGGGTGVDLGEGGDNGGGFGTSPPVRIVEEVKILGMLGVLVQGSKLEKDRVRGLEKLLRGVEDKP